MSVNAATMLMSVMPDAETEQRGEDREAHRDHRAEREQQDHDRGEQTDEVGVARRAARSA